MGGTDTAITAAQWTGNQPVKHCNIYRAEVSDTHNESARKLGSPGAAHKVVPQTDAIVDAGCQQLAACEWGEVGGIHHLAVLQHP